MAVRLLTLDQIKELDGGRVWEAFNQAVARAVKDCENRPGNRKERKVVLQVGMKPHLDEDGRCYEVDFSFAIKDTAPQANSAVYRGAVKPGGKLAFNDLSDDYPQQRTLDEDTDAFDG